MIYFLSKKRVLEYILTRETKYLIFTKYTAIEMHFSISGIINIIYII